MWRSHCEIDIPLEGDDPIHYANTHFNATIADTNTSALVDDDMGVCIESANLESLRYSCRFIRNDADCSSCHMLPRHMGGVSHILFR
jgi:hypothetical protein